MNILMPQLGETVAEGTIGKWYKALGDAVGAGEILFEIETDKTSMEVPALAAGVLHDIRVQAGQTVPVGAVVAVLTETAASGAQSGSTPPAEAGSAPQAANGSKDLTSAPSSGQRPIDPFHGVRTPEKNFGRATLPSGAKVTPLARRLAGEAGVDLARIQGSGPRGRIVAADVRRAAAQTPSAPAAPAARLERGATSAGPARAYREVPLDSMRKTIARRLTESKQQVPHFYVSADFNVEALLALRKQINEVGQVRVSVNDLVVKAYALALQRVPAANVVWDNDRLLQFERSDVGVAVAVPGGLVTPVVRSADVKSVAALAAEVADLVVRARERKLQPAEYTGGTATVSNLGMYGVRSFQAIVNPPQATILAVGAAERRPVEKDGALGLATMLSVSISVDHRAVDGAIAGELLAALRKIIEQPVSMFL